MDNDRLSVFSLQIDKIQDDDENNNKTPQNIDNKRLSVVSLIDDAEKDIRELNKKRCSVISVQISEDNEYDDHYANNNTPQNIDNKRLSVVSLQIDDGEKDIRELNKKRCSVISVQISEDNEEEDVENTNKTPQNIDNKRLSVVSSILEDEERVIREMNEKRRSVLEKIASRGSLASRPSLAPSISVVNCDDFEDFEEEIAPRVDNKRLSVISLQTTGEEDVRELNEKRRSVLCDRELQEEIEAQKMDKFERGAAPTGRTSVLVSNSRISRAPSIVLSCDNLDNDEEETNAAVVANAPQNVDNKRLSVVSLQIDDIKYENNNLMKEHVTSDEEEGYPIKKSASRESCVSNFSRVSCVSNFSMMSRTSMLSNAGLTSTDACGGTGVPVLNFDLKKAKEQAQRSGSVMSMSAEEKAAILAKRRKSSCVSMTSRKSIARYKRNQVRRKQEIGTFDDTKNSKMTLLNFDEQNVKQAADEEQENEDKEDDTRASVFSQFGNFVEKLKKGSTTSLFGNGRDENNNIQERRNTEDFIRYELEKKQQDEENWRMYNTIFGGGIAVCLLLILIEHKYSKQAGQLSVFLFLGLLITNVSKMGDKLQDKREVRANRRITHARQSVIGRNSVTAQNQLRKQTRTRQNRPNNNKNNKHRPSMTLSQALSNV